MLPMKSSLNNCLNSIHTWGEPEQNPMKRMFLTRLGGIAGTAIETTAIGWSVVRIGMLCTRECKNVCMRTFCRIIPAASSCMKYVDNPSLKQSIKDAFMDTCKLIAGVATTLFIGIIFSPELNFRIHIKLGLAVNNLTVQKQKELDAKLRTETKAAEITKARAEQFAQFEQERKALKDAQDQEDAIDSHLAELLYPKIMRYKTSN